MGTVLVLLLVLARSVLVRVLCRVKHLRYQQEAGMLAHCALRVPNLSADSCLSLIILY